MQENLFENPSWENMYRHAAGRTNLIEWIPFNGTENVLLVGDDSEVITEYLREKSAVLTVVGKDLNSIGDENRYDYIFSIGSLPFAEDYLPGEGITAYEKFLQFCKRHLMEEGHLILALPNKLGLKYFAGCRDDHFGAPFTGLEDYYFHKGRRTFGKNELTRLLEDAGIAAEEQQWFYPYPDYRFANFIYSDEYLPKEGELHTNLVNYDQERYVFFDETKVWDTIIREGRFAEFSNSFLVIVGKEKISDLKFVKYSAERDKKYALRTEICGDENHRCARKVALYAEGSSHIKHIEKAGKDLQKQYESAGLRIDPCKLDTSDDSAIRLDYIQGDNLQKIMEDLIIQDRHDDVKRIIDEYTRRILSVENCVSDIDLIFSNLIVDAQTNQELEGCAAGIDVNKICDSNWTVIDYEWTFDEPIDVRFILYRAYFFACHQLMASPVLNLEKLCGEVGITEEDIESYTKQEEEFQKKVIGNTRPERDLLGLIGNPIIPFVEMDRAYREVPAKNEELERLRAENERLRDEVAHFGIKSAIKKKFGK